MQAAYALWVCSLGTLISSAVGLNNGLAIKPPLAYSNWNIVGGNVNESFIMKQADTLVSSGLAKAGYEYVIVDDCWSSLDRDKDGRLQANTTTFPSGMRALGDYIHSKGLKFGMYADAGTKTCQYHPGSRGYEEIDAQSFAEWGVDYLKYDNYDDRATEGGWIAAGHASKEDWVVDRYAAMSNALNKTGRPVLFAIVGWGVGDPWKGWGIQYGNVWRTDGDITASWPEIMRVLDNSVGLMRYSKPSGWADLDMLEVGIGFLTFQEQRSHFALWALMKSPLMLGTDLTLMTPEQMEVVSNEEVLAVNQDALGVPGDLIWKEGPAEVYAGPLKDGSRVVALLNRHTLATQYPVSDVTVDWEWMGFPAAAKATVRDLFAKEDLGVFTKSFTAKVDIHDVVLLRITLNKDASRYSSWRPWTARQYVPVPSVWRNWVVISAGCIAALAGAGVLLYAALYVTRLCLSGSAHKRFARMDVDRKRRSQSGRLGSGDKAIEAVA